MHLAPNDPCGSSRSQRMRRHVLRNHGLIADDRAVADLHPLHHGRFRTNPHMIADVHGSRRIQATVFPVEHRMGIARPDGDIVRKHAIFADHDFRIMLLNAQVCGYHTGSRTDLDPAVLSFEPKAPARTTAPFAEADRMIVPTDVKQGIADLRAASDEDRIAVACNILFHAVKNSPPSKIIRLSLPRTGQSAKYIRRSDCTALNRKFDFRAIAPIFFLRFIEKKIGSGPAAGFLFAAEQQPQLLQVVRPGQKCRQAVNEGPAERPGEQFRRVRIEAPRDAADGRAHDGHLTERRQQIAHLPEKPHADQLSGVVRVDEQTHVGGDDRPPAHRFHPQRDRYAQDADSDRLLDDFEAQEQIGTSLDLQQIEVDRMDRIPHAAQTQDAEQPGRRQPRIVEQHGDHRFGEYGQPDHQRKYDECRQPQEFAIDRAQPVVLLLDRTQHGKSYALHDAREVGARKLCELVGPRIVTELRSGEAFADHERINIFINGVDQSGDHQFGTECEQLSERGAGKDPQRTPAHEQPQQHRIETDVGDIVKYDGPHAPAGIGGGDAGRAGDDRRKYRGFGLRAEVDPHTQNGPRHDRQ